MKEFKCLTHGVFESEGYPNPVFLVDTCADCPQCESKCWETTVKITTSELKRLRDLGNEVTLFE